MLGSVNIYESKGACIRPKYYSTNVFFKQSVLDQIK
jgi:hypothetical protein